MDRKRVSSAARLTSRELLLEVLDHAFDRASWHGPNLTGAIRGVNAAMAARSVKGRKSIWEQVLHAAYWKHRVLNKLVGTSKFGRKGSNWPKPPKEPSEAAWREDVAFLHEVHRRLRAAVENLGDEIDYAARKLIHGVAFHDIYHAGQIRLNRRMME